MLLPMLLYKMDDCKTSHYKGDFKNGKTRKF